MIIMACSVVGLSFSVCQHNCLLLMCMIDVCATVQSVEDSLTARDSNWCCMAVITLSSLLAASVLTIIIGLTIALLRIKGKSSCTKGDTFPHRYVNRYSCCILHVFLFHGVEYDRILTDLESRIQAILEL